MRLGVFGGTFNPIHYGHLRAAEEVRERLGLDRVLFVPSGMPPLKSADLAPGPHRLEMVRLAIASQPGFEASDIEMARPSVSFTVDTLEALGRLHPDASLVFIMGLDSFLEIRAWREPERLMRMADFAVVARPGYEFSALGGGGFVYVEGRGLEELDAGGVGPIEARLPGGRTAYLMRTTPYAVSATQVRTLRRRGLSIRYLLPEPVESYIISHGVYA